MIEDLRHRILREQIRLAMEQLPTMQAASLIVALILCFAVRAIVPYVNIFEWITLVTLVVISRIVLYHRFKKVREDSFAGEPWKNAYLILALISGLIWGLSAFIIFPAGDPWLISLFLLVIASLSSGATVSHSSFRFGPIAWVGPATLPYAIRCAMEGGEFGYITGILIILFLFALLHLSFERFRFTTSAIALKFENRENLQLINELQEALAKVKTLSGLLPICAYCKKIRNDEGYWQQLEAYVHQHSEAQFSHGVCPECYAKVKAELDKEMGRT